MNAVIGAILTGDHDRLPEVFNNVTSFSLSFNIFS